MKRKYTLKTTISLLLSFLICFSLSADVSSICFDSNTNSDSVNLVLDTQDNNNIPKKFRKTTDLSLIDNKNFNLTGLDKLNMSGSEQFSALNLPKLLAAIGTTLPIIDVDLRQESHGFINGLAVSWENEKNDANKGLSREEVLAKEKSLLDGIKLNVPLTFFNDDKKTITPTETSTENELMEKNSISYIRVLATDRELPTPINIDYFVQSIMNSPKDVWFHFHCKEGIGRTTTFMIFYDMMKNYKDVSPQDIISRQLNLVQFTESDIELLTSDRRMTLYNTFYNYCLKYGDDFKVPYSEYIESLGAPQEQSSSGYPIELVI